MSAATVRGEETPATDGPRQDRIPFDAALTATHRLGIADGWPRKHRLWSPPVPDAIPD